MDGCLLVFGSKHDAKHKLDRLVVCYDINHGLMYIKGKKRRNVGNTKKHSIVVSVMKSAFQKTIYTANSNGQSTSPCNYVLFEILGNRVVLLLMS